MIINNKIGKNKIFAGFTWGEAIRHAGNLEEPDTWIVKVEKQGKLVTKGMLFCYFETTFSHYELKAYETYNSKDRSLKVPKSLNDYVERGIRIRNLEIGEYKHI